MHLENVGLDVAHVARSLAGLTVGEMMEGVRDTAGKVGGEARRLRTEAVRVQKVRGGFLAEGERESWRQSLLCASTVLQRSGVLKVLW